MRLGVLENFTTDSYDGGESMFTVELFEKAGDAMGTL